MLINRTNQIASFDQLMKRLRDHLSNICCMRDTAATVMQLLSFGFFLWERLPLFRFALRVDRILLKISFPFPRSTCSKWHPLCELHFQGVQILLILANFLTETGWSIRDTRWSTGSPSGLFVVMSVYQATHPRHLVIIFFTMNTQTHILTNAKKTY